MPTFDGDNLLITLDSGVTEIDAQEDLYEPWKDWVLLSDNAKYPIAFGTEGGNPITTQLNSGSYFFIQNQEGWRIRPPEEDITISVTGNLVPQDTLLDVIIPTLGNYRVLVLGLQPVTQTVAISDLQTDATTILKILRNKTITDPVANTITVYEEDGTTIFLQAALFEDAAGAQGYQGQGAERRERLT